MYERIQPLSGANIILIEKQNAKQRLQNYCENNFHCLN